MRERYLRFGLVIICIFTLLISCGGSSTESGGDSGSKVSSISLSANPASIPADGFSTSTVTAALFDKDGKPLSESGAVPVTFSTNLGTFTENGSSNYTKYTESGGNTVTASLLASREEETARITVTAEGTTKQINIPFTHFDNDKVVAEEFSLSANYLNISGLSHVGLEDIITARVGNIYGNPIQAGTAVEFKTYGTGGMISPAEVPTGESGTAASTLVTTSGPTPMQGFVSVTAETQGGPTTRVTSLAVTPYPDDHIIYAGTNGGGVYKSSNSGETWENISRSTDNPKQGQNWMDPYIKGHSAICVDSDNHNTVYVGTGYLGAGNLYRSLDGGMNWNSNNVEEWCGVFSTNAAVLTVLCDGDDTATDYPYVWTGTEGLGILYSVNGTNFQPSCGTVTTPVPRWWNAGNGTMSDPVLSYSSQTETWTATCFVADASATVPVLGEDAKGNGIMSLVTTSPTTKTENWTVTYTGSAQSMSVDAPRVEATVPVAGGGNTGDGTMSPVVVYDLALVEDWTVTCISVAVDGGTFSVTGSVSGAQSDYDITTGTYTITDVLSFAISDGATDFAVGDTFTFSTVDSGSDRAVGDVSNIVLKGAGSETWTLECVTDSSNAGVNAGEEIFSVHGTTSGYKANAIVGTAYESDAINFLINPGAELFCVGDKITFYTNTFWRVSGTVSGVQALTAQIDSPYHSDNHEVTFSIYKGSSPFEPGDAFTFTTIGQTTFWTVSGTKSGVQYNSAQNNTVYTSDNDEVSFIIYEGSIPFADGDTFTFSVTASDIGHGWTVWDIVKVPDTHGSSAILYAATNVGLFKSTNGGRTWSETSNFTGDYITSLYLNTSSTGGSNDVIYAGTLNAGVWVSTNSGTGWTQYPDGMKAGRSASIKDLLADSANGRLYALSYDGPVDHATGNVYSHALNTNGSMAAGNWDEANTGLPGGALYAMAMDDPSEPAGLFAGGEGIKLYRAESGLDTGSPAWDEKVDGIDNTIMARMPILFSGNCSMTIDQFQYDNTVYYTVYIQDVNGNPPIVGSAFKVTYNDNTEIINLTYPDCFTHEGTFRDPGNPYTNYPYRLYVTLDPAEDKQEVEFVFTPANTLGDETYPNVPGSSGAEQRVTYSY